MLQHKCRKPQPVSKVKKLTHRFWAPMSSCAGQRSPFVPNMWIFNLCDSCSDFTPLSAICSFLSQYNLPNSVLIHHVPRSARIEHSLMWQAGETTPRTASKETGGQCWQCWPDHHTLSMSSGGPSAWMCPRRKGWSRWDVRTEATFTHIDERSSQRHVALYAQSQLATRRADSTCFLCVPPPHPLHPPPTLHTHLLTYLLPSRAHTRVQAHTHTHTPRLPTGPVIAVRLLCIHTRKPRLSLSVSLIWIQNN